MEPVSDAPEATRSADPTRAPYESPRLVVYGDVRTLTSGGMGVTEDGGGMFTHK
jgi:hypothetical protein